MIKKISLLISFLGLFLIYLVEVTSSVPYTNLSEITESDIGEYVKVCGIVDKNYFSDSGTIFFDLKENSSIKVVIFKNAAELISKDDVENGNHLCLEGVVKRYRGTLEIIADRIILDSRE